MNKIKKTLASIVLTGSMALGISGKTNADVIFNEDFESFGQKYDSSGVRDGGNWGHSYYFGNKDYPSEGLQFKLDIYQGNIVNSRSVSGKNSMNLNGGNLDLASTMCFGLIGGGTPSLNQFQWECKVMYDASNPDSSLSFWDCAGIDSSFSVKDGKFKVSNSNGDRDQFGHLIYIPLMDISPNKWYELHETINNQTGTDSLEIIDTSTGQSATFNDSFSPYHSSGGYMESQAYGSANFYIDDLSAQAVPEPATLGMLTLGGFGLASLRRKNESKK